MSTADVPGLSYLPDFVSAAEEQALSVAVDGGAWLADLQRRVQHHGYRYDYKLRSVDAAARLGPLPGWSLPVASRLRDGGWVDRMPDQLIVNEYEPGQGISAHTDCVPCFGPVVASLSLLSSCEMLLSDPTSGLRAPILLRPRSLLVLAGAARYRFRHAIAARRTDLIDGVRCPRSRRLSLTFRTVLVGA